MKSIFKGLKEFIQVNVLRQISYWAEGHYKFELGSGALKPISKNRAIVVLSRSRYTEEVAWYPITKKSDLHKLADLKQQQSAEPLLYKIGTSVEGKTPVTYYTIKGESADLSKTRVLIPETILMEFGFSDFPDSLFSYDLIGNSQSVLCVKTTAGLESAISKGLFANVANFAMAHGVLSSSAQHIDTSAHISSVINGLFKVHLWFGKGLLDKSTRNKSDHSNRLAAYSLAVFGAITLYLYIANFAAGRIEEYKKQNLAGLMQQANVALTGRNLISDGVMKYESLAGHVPSPGRYSVIWAALDPVFSDGSAVRNMEFNGQQLSVQIESDSATNLLQSLTQSTFVANAEFGTPVRRVRNKDIGTIILDLRLDQDEVN